MFCGCHTPVHDPEILSAFSPQSGGHTFRTPEFSPHFQANISAQSSRMPDSDGDSDAHRRRWATIHVSGLHTHVTLAELKACKGAVKMHLKPPHSLFHWMQKKIRTRGYVFQLNYFWISPEFRIFENAMGTQYFEHSLLRTQWKAKGFEAKSQLYPSVQLCVFFAGCGVARCIVFTKDGSFKNLASKSAFSSDGTKIFSAENSKKDIFSP